MRRMAKRPLECATEMREIGKAETQRGIGYIPDASFGERLVAGRQTLLPEPANWRGTFSRKQPVQCARRQVLGRSNALDRHFGIMQIVDHITLHPRKAQVMPTFPFVC